MEATETSPLIASEHSTSVPKASSAVSIRNGRVSIDEEAEQDLVDTPDLEGRPNTHTIIPILLFGTLLHQGLWSIGERLRG
jgi:hypothetical protein